jgi:L-2-hydroxyglutarate oxidase LhgO
VSIDYNGNYDLNELSFALSVVLNHNKKFKNTLVVGDPSELLYQAYVFAQTNQNPNFIKEEAQFYSKQEKDTYVFLYPVGMVAQDIRKEISHLVYVLKKFNKSTFLLRADKSHVSAILQKMLNQLSSMNEHSKFSVKGVEQLISRQEHFST